MKKGMVIFICISLILVLSLSMVSAGWWSDFWSKIFGKKGPSLSPTGCSETDGGAMYFVKGSTDYFAVVYEDFCINQNFVTEYFCNLKQGIRNITFACPNGCVDGACSCLIKSDCVASGYYCDKPIATAPGKCILCASGVICSETCCASGATGCDNIGQCLIPPQQNCIPNCTGKVCGSDGCSGTCPPGCTDQQTCDNAGQCVDNPTLISFCGVEDNTGVTPCTIYTNSSVSWKEHTVSLYSIVPQMGAEIKIDQTIFSPLLVNGYETKMAVNSKVDMISISPLASGGNKVEIKLEVVLCTPEELINTAVNPPMCPNGYICNENLKCVICLANCSGKECGSNGCGGSCGSCPNTGPETFCDTLGQCVVPPQQNCIPTNCNALNYTCGLWEDNCNGTLNCGTCAVGEECKDGLCAGIIPQQGCTSDDNCTGGYICDSSTGDCVPPGEQPKPCVSDSDCATGYTCDTTTGSCVLTTTEECTADLECASGETCVAGVCTPSGGEVECITSSDCAFDEYCAEGGVCTPASIGCTCEDVPFNCQLQLICGFQVNCGDCSLIPGTYCSGGVCTPESTCEEQCDASYQCGFVCGTTPCGAGCSGAQQCDLGEHLCFDPATADYCPKLSESGANIRPGTRAAFLEEGGTIIKYCDPLTLDYSPTIDIDAEDISCNNDYECTSNVCIDGSCTSIKGELDKQKGILTKIWCYVSNPFAYASSGDCKDLTNGYCACLLGA